MGRYGQVVQKLQKILDLMTGLRKVRENIPRKETVVPVFKQRRELVRTGEPAHRMSTHLRYDRCPAFVFLCLHASKYSEHDGLSRNSCLHLGKLLRHWKFASKNGYEKHARRTVYSWDCLWYMSLRKRKLWKAL
jgi:hypothetical protein